MAYFDKWSKIIVKLKVLVQVLGAVIFLVTFFVVFSTKKKGGGGIFWIFFFLGCKF
jgi:hypothetical protein